MKAPASTMRFAAARLAFSFVVMGSSWPQRAASEVTLGPQDPPRLRDNSPFCGQIRRWPWVVLPNQAVFVGVGGGGGARGHVQLAEDVAHVPIHGLLAQKQLG